MLDPDNDRRNAAAASLDIFFKTAGCVVASMQQIQNSTKPQARQMAAVLLRKKLSAGLWRQNQSKWEQIQQLLLRRLASESVWLVRKAVAALASRVAKLSIPDGRWPQYVPFLVKMVSQQEESKRAVGMLLFRAMSENLGQEMAQSIANFSSVVQKCLTDTSLRVREEAFKAMEGIVNYLETKEQVTLFSKLVPTAVKSVREILTKSSDDEKAIVGLELFGALAESPVPVLDPFIGPIVKFMLEVTVNPQRSESVADNAIQFIQSVVDAAPARIIRAGLVKDVLRADFYLLSKPSEDPFEVDVVTHQKIGSSLLQTLVESIPYKQIFEPCLRTAVRFMKNTQSADQRRAGLMIIANIAEGFNLLLKPVLPTLVDATLSLLNDSSNNVRIAACVCLLQLCDHIQPDIQNHHERLVPTMLRVLGRPNENQMVRVKMCVATCAFVENLDNEIAQRYLRPLMVQFGSLVACGQPDLVEMAVAGIQSCAITAEKAFTPYFQKSMEAMLHFMRKKADEDLKMRARATECIGFIAVAVGPEKFAPVLKTVLALAEENFKLTFFTLSESTFRLYANLSICLGERFAPVVKHAHVRAMKSLASFDGIEFRRKGDDMNAFHAGDVKGGSDDDDRELFEGMQYSIKSGAVDEKTAAIQCAATFLEYCGRAYLPYVGQLVKICEEILEYPQAMIRTGVAIALEEIVNLAARLFPSNNGVMQPNARKLLVLALPHLLEIAQIDPDLGTAASACDALKACLDKFGQPALALMGNRLLKVLVILLQEQSPCQAAFRDDQGEDGKTQAVQLDHDEILIDHVFDLLLAVAHAMGPKFDSLFPKFLPLILRFNGPDRSDSDKLMAIGCLADINHEIKAKIVPYIPQLSPMLIASLDESEVGIRRNGAYALGLMAQHGGKRAIPFFKQAIQKLSRCMVIPQEKKDDTAFQACRDNACSAVGKMMLVQPALVTPPVIGLYMKGLPLLNDLAEAKFVYPLMARLVQNKSVPADARVLFICGRVFGNEGIENQVKMGLVSVAKAAAQSIGKDAASQVVRRLEPDEQRQLQRALAQ